MGAAAFLTKAITAYGIGQMPQRRKAGQRLLERTDGLTRPVTPCGALLVQTLVLLLPAPGEGQLDEAGLGALAVLRALGMPQTVALVPTALPTLQAKAAAKKHAAALLSSQVGWHRRGAGLMPRVLDLLHPLQG